MVKAKSNRLDTIKLIISSRDISSQDEILVELNEAGYEVTQATLSRDLKKLKVAKASTADGRYWMIPEYDENSSYPVCKKRQRNRNSLSVETIL